AGLYGSGNTREQGNGRRLAQSLHASEEGSEGDAVSRSISHFESAAHTAWTRAVDRDDQHRGLWRESGTGERAGCKRVRGTLLNKPRRRASRHGQGSVR